MSECKKGNLFFETLFFIIILMKKSVENWLECCWWLTTRLSWLRAIHYNEMNPIRSRVEQEKEMKLKLSELSRGSYGNGLGYASDMRCILNNAEEEVLLAEG